MVGIVTLGDVRSAEPSTASTLSVWEMNNLLAKLKVAEIMTREPVTISQEATISTVAEIMLEKKFSGLPVVDDAGQVGGHHHRVGYLPARRAGVGQDVTGTARIIHILR